MNIGVIGAGSWGTALAIHLARVGHSISLWVFEDDLAEAINETRENSQFLKGFPCPDSVRAFHETEEVLSKSDILFLVVPSQFMRGVLAQCREHYRGQPLVCCSKGVEIGTLQRMSQVIHSVLGESIPHAVLSGPTFAREVAAGLPAAAVVASDDHTLAVTIQDLFSSEQFRLYTSEDPTGVELGGALKNIVALATGIVFGLEGGHNAVAALITRGLHEISRLGVFLGGTRETLAGLSGMGDLILTCTGELSRNRSVGIRLGKGETIREITESMQMVAEGVATTRSVYELTEKHGIEMPITRAVYRVIYEGESPPDMVRELMTRKLKREDLL